MGKEVIDIDFVRKEQGYVYGETDSDDSEGLAYQLSKEREEEELNEYLNMCDDYKEYESKYNKAYDLWMYWVSFMENQSCTSFPISHHSRNDLMSQFMDYYMSLNTNTKTIKFEHMLYDNPLNIRKIITEFQ